MSGELKQTPLFEYHIETGAKMVPFAGWNMPVQYSEGIIAEHNHTRRDASIFDICHMGEFRLAGSGAPALMDGIFCRKVSSQKVGSCHYNLLLNSDGMVLDDLIIYRMAEEDFFIVVNAGTIARDFDAIKKQLPAGIDFENLSDSIGKIDLQGPRSAEVLAVCGVEIDKLPAYFHWTMVEIDGIRCILSRTGYTGELGFELYCDIGRVEDLWIKLYNIDPVRPAGLGARDTLRLEMGYALYGHELSLAVSPLEANFGLFLKLDEVPKRMFTGREALESRKVGRKLYGIRLDGRRAARGDAKVFAVDDEAEVGVVTSGAFAPSVGCAVALAYLDAGRDFKVGDKVLLEAGTSRIPGEIVELPFYKKGTVREKICK